MKTVAAVALLSLFFVTLAAAQPDAAGCQDHPLVPRLQGYYISGCSSADAVFDADVSTGKGVETVHIAGKSKAFLYSTQPDLKSKPSEAQLRRDFETTLAKQGGKRVGETYGQKWPIYKLVKNGKEIWVVLMVNSGEYFTGAYAYRIVGE